MRQSLKSRHGQDELEMDKLDDRVIGRFKDCGINGVIIFSIVAVFVCFDFGLLVSGDLLLRSAEQRRQGRRSDPNTLASLRG